MLFVALFGGWILARSTDLGARADAPRRRVLLRFRPEHLPERLVHPRAPARRELDGVVQLVSVPAPRRDHLRDLPQARHVRQGHGAVRVPLLRRRGIEQKRAAPCPPVLGARPSRHRARGHEVAHRDARVRERGGGAGHRRGELRAGCFEHRDVHVHGGFREGVQEHGAFQRAMQQRGELELGVALTHFAARAGGGERRQLDVHVQAAPVVRRRAGLAPLPRTVHAAHHLRGVELHVGRPGGLRDDAGLDEDVAHLLQPPTALSRAGHDSGQHAARTPHRARAGSAAAAALDNFSPSGNFTPSDKSHETLLEELSSAEQEIINTRRTDKRTLLVN